MERRSLAAVSSTAALMLVLASCGGGDGEGESDDPIVVGSTLSLTGAFAATGAIHKIAGEQFVDRLNADGGLLGRQVEWTVLDDESDQAKVSPLYEQLISQDKVDLIIGPYATPNILSAMAVAERHGYVLPQHTAVHRAAAHLRVPVPGLVDRPDAERVRPEPAVRRGREAARRRRSGRDR